MAAGGPSHGSLTLNSTGHYTYKPDSTYHGADSFTFIASDGTNTSNTATVSITVIDTTTPVANNQTVSTNENVSLPISLSAADSDGACGVDNVHRHEVFSLRSRCADGA